MKTHDTAVMGYGIALSLEFWNCTHIHGTHGCDTTELPVPMLHPSRAISIPFPLSLPRIMDTLIHNSLIDGMPKFGQRMARYLSRTLGARMGLLSMVNILAQ